MAVPKYYEFMKPILEAMKDNKEVKRSDLAIKMVSYFNLSDEDKLQLLPSGKIVYKDRISWALTYLKKSKLITSPSRGVYYITELGHEVLTENPEVIDSKYLMKFEDFREFTNSAKQSVDVASDNDVADKSPQELLDSAYKTISSSLIDDVINEIINQTPSFFEKLVVDLLVCMGYGGSKIENSKVLGKSGDEGIDGVIKEDKLGFDKIYVQAKRWDKTTKVGRPELQKFVGALTGQGAMKGAFITTAGFSKGAEDYCKKQHACKIVLIDGVKLASLMIEYNLGVSVENTYEIKRIDSDYFSDESV